MKKIALTSLFAVFAVSGVHAANVFDNSPLYMPKAGHAYSLTTLGSHSGSEEIKSWGLNEEFGYGITDKFAVNVATTIYDQQSFNEWSWGDFDLAMAYRALDMGVWKMDLVGQYSLSPVWGNHASFLDKDWTNYIWTAGLRGGYVSGDLTIAGHAYFSYLNSESFNWSEDAGERGIHYIILGLDGQYVIDSKWSVLAGVEYTGIMDKELYGVPGWEVKNAGNWTGTFGVNYNIDAAKFVGAYITGDMDHQGGDAADEWDFNKGFGFGAKFGIDF